MGMQGKVAIITGGARGIGLALCNGFKQDGAQTFTIDRLQNPDFVGDLSNEATLAQFAEMVITRFGKIDYLVNNAMLTHGGLTDCTYDQFNETLRVWVTAPFYLAKLFHQHWNAGAAIVNISSTRFAMSQPETESYTAAKGGITALTHALAITLSG